MCVSVCCFYVFFFQAEDGIRDRSPSRGLGDVYKRQALRMFGIATTMMPLTASAMSALPPEEASQATAANNTVRQIGNAVVVALLSSVTQNVIKAAKPAKDLAKENVVSYMDKMINATMTGFHASFAFGIGFAVVGIILAFFLHSGKLCLLYTSDAADEEDSVALGGRRIIKKKKKVKKRENKEKKKT